jgi:small-conductance mechanosensitive channel
MPDFQLPQGERIAKVESALANIQSNMDRWMNAEEQRKKDDRQKQDDRHQENQAALRDQKAVLEEIKQQTTRTNGRLTAVEAALVELQRWRAGIIGFAKGSKWVATLAGAAGLALIEHVLGPWITALFHLK